MFRETVQHVLTREVYAEMFKIVRIVVSDLNIGLDFVDFEFCSISYLIQEILLSKDAYVILHLVASRCVAH